MKTQPTVFYQSVEQRSIILRKTSKSHLLLFPFKNRINHQIWQIFPYLIPLQEYARLKLSNGKPFKQYLPYFNTYKYTQYFIWVFLLQFKSTIFQSLNCRGHCLYVSNCLLPSFSSIHEELFRLIRLVFPASSVLDTWTFLLLCLWTVSSWPISF